MCQYRLSGCGLCASTSKGGVALILISTNEESVCAYQYQ